MRDDPAELYEWARKTLKFKTKDSEQEIKKLFLNAVDLYFEKDVNFESDSDESESNLIFQDELYEDRDVSCEGQSEGIKTLLDLILMVHQKKWEKLFDFCDYFSCLKYQSKDKKIEPPK